MYHRQAQYAGSFYPGQAAELSSQIDSYLCDAHPKLKGSLVAVLSPHAGYVYSGEVAAWSFKALGDAKIDVAVILAPSHRAQFPGFSMPLCGAYTTPLGECSVDDIICRKLGTSPRYFFHEQLDAAEHSLEVQLPFLQRILPAPVIVPLIIGTTDFDECALMADDIYSALKGESRRIGIIISTDLSHYYSYNEAYAMDKKFIDALASFDPSAVDALLQSGDAEACGHGPLLCGMFISRKMGAHSVEVLRYATSGDTAGDKMRVVGYVSAAFTEE